MASGMTTLKRCRHNRPDHSGVNGAFFVAEWPDFSLLYLGAVFLKFLKPSLTLSLVHKDMDRDGISVYVAKDMDKDGFKNLTNTVPWFRLILHEF